MCIHTKYVCVFLFITVKVVACFADQDVVVTQV